MLFMRSASYASLCMHMCILQTSLQNDMTFLELVPELMVCFPFWNIVLHHQ